MFTTTKPKITVYSTSFQIRQIGKSCPQTDKASNGTPETECEATLEVTKTKTLAETASQSYVAFQIRTLLVVQDSTRTYFIFNSRRFDSGSHNLNVDVSNTFFDSTKSVRKHPSSLGHCLAIWSLSLSRTCISRGCSAC